MVSKDFFRSFQEPAKHRQFYEYLRIKQESDHRNTIMIILDNKRFQIFKVLFERMHDIMSLRDVCMKRFSRG